MQPKVTACEQRVDRYVFNHDILSCTHSEVTGNHLYSGRALGLTEPLDIIQIHPFLRGQIETIYNHYDRIGLEHSRNIVWDTSPKRLIDYPGLPISVFFFGPRENAAAAHHDWYRVVEHINSKNNFSALANQLRIDTPHTIGFHGRQWFAGIEHFTYPCYLKAAVSVAGKGIYRCETEQDLLQALARFDDDVPLQVQDEVISNEFLNLQYMATDRALNRVLVTEQLLNGYTHLGNRYPAEHEPWDSVQPMAEWLYEKGMRGLFAFDVAVVHEKQGTRFMAIECNPRFNGASYPTMIACRLHLDAWVAKEFKTRHQQLADLDLSGIEFDPGTRTGIVLVNWGTILASKIGVLIAGTPRQQLALETELIQRL